MHINDPQKIAHSTSGEIFGAFQFEIEGFLILCLNKIYFADRDQLKEGSISIAFDCFRYRFLLGLGAGLEITISPVYIHEICRPVLRDVAGSFPQVSLKNTVLIGKGSQILFKKETSIIWVVGNNFL